MIEKVLDNPGYKAAAKEIAEGFKKSGGVERAKAFIESLGRISKH